MASAGDDGTIRVWDPATGKLLRALVGHNMSLSGPSLSWSPDGTLACGEQGGRASIWDAETGRLLRGDVFGTNLYNGWSLAWSPDGQWLGAGGDRDPVLLKLVDGSYASLRCGRTTLLVWSPDGKAVACWAPSGHLDTAAGVIHVWDMDTFTERSKLESRGSQSARLAWLPDGTLLAFAGEKAEIWDLATRQLRHSFTPSGSAVAWSPDSRCVAFSGAWHMEVYEAGTGAMRWKTGGTQGGAIAFSPDGQVVAVPGGGGSILLLDAKLGTLQRVIDGYSPLGNSSVGAAFSPEGSRLALGCPGRPLSSGTSRPARSSDDWCADRMGWRGLAMGRPSQRATIL